MKQIGLPFFLVGVIFIVVGIYVLTNGANKSKKCTVETIGTVIDYYRTEYRDSNDKYHYSYYPIISYMVGLETIKQTSDSGANPPKYKINEKVSILYNPNKINEFIIKGTSSNYILLGVLSIFLGSVPCIFGVKFFK